MKPLIGIIGRPRLTNNNLSFMGAEEECIRAIIRCGGNAIIIPPVSDIDYNETMPRDVKDLTKEEQVDFYSLIDKCDGLLFPGGRRIYNYDVLACKYAIEKDIPTLGICMGMQVMNIVDTNVKPIPTINKHRIEDKKYVHDVIICDNGVLSNILDKKLTVNSVHTYAVSEVKDFIIEAKANDNVIEAISLPNKKFIVGVQWHPERLMDENSTKLIKTFIEKCR